MKLLKHFSPEKAFRADYRKRLATVSLMACAFLLGAVTSAGATMSQKEVAGKVEKEFGVQVLRVEPMAENGKNMFAVTVMSPAGDRNSAYQVNTVVVDAATGNLVIQWGHGSSGHYLPAPPVSERTHPLTELDH